MLLTGYSDDGFVHDDASDRARTTRSDQQIMRIASLRHPALFAALLGVVILADTSWSRAHAQDKSGTIAPIDPSDPNARSSWMVTAPGLVGSFENMYVTDQVGDGSVQRPVTLNNPINVNNLLGADRFYNAGLHGGNAVMANIEAGYVWSGHETLGRVQQIPVGPSGNAAGQVDRHATWVGSVMGGQLGGPAAAQGEYQRGIADGAALYSGAVASNWNGSAYALNFTFYYTDFFDSYRRAFANGIGPNGRTADVINSSFGGGGTDDANGTSYVDVGLDGLAYQNPNTLFVASAGNSGAGPNKVGGPAAAYNNLSVAALDAYAGAGNFSQVASFSSGGPNDYKDPVNGTIGGARQVVDIAAPGTNIVAAYYGGQTGGNGSTLSGSPSGPLGGPDYYSSTIAGTSFAAPTVAGGVALLDDAAYANLASDPNARDARVIKAVLMNSADKTTGWDNGQHTDSSGAIITTQGLDNRVGTGRMDLNKAYDQLLSGTKDVAGTGSGNLGAVAQVGWDYGLVHEGVNNDYYFTKPLLGGTTFTATLDWFRDRSFDNTNTAFDNSYDNLDLELWTVVNGVAGTLVAASQSLYNNSEHFYITLAQTGDYLLRVKWTGSVFDVVNSPNQTTYGLAWSGTFAAVPEPTSLTLMLLGSTGLALSIRRRALA